MLLGSFFVDWTLEVNAIFMESLVRDATFQPLFILFFLVVDATFSTRHSSLHSLHAPSELNDLVILWTSRVSGILGHY